MIEQRGGLIRLGQQHVQRWEVVVPLDQCRHPTEARQGLHIERPDLRRNARTVIVDKQGLAALDLLHGMAGEVDLSDRLRRQGVQVGHGVPAVVARADVDVVDIAEDAAPRALRHLGDEFPFGNGRVRVAKVARRVLDQDSALQPILCLIHMAADEVERLVGHGQRQQVGQVGAARHAPGEVLRDEPGLDAANDLPDAFEVGKVQAFGAAEGQPDAMQRNRIVAPDRLERPDGGAAAHVVLGMRLQPRDIGSCFKHGLMVLEAQPDPCSGRHGVPCVSHDVVSAQAAFRLPPWILLQSPAGRSTKDFGSRACVDWPAQE